MGDLEIGPLIPNSAIWICWPGFTSRPITRRFLRVPAHHNGPAALAGRMRQLAVHPYLGVVVDLRLEHDGRAGRIEVADVLGNREPDAVPVEGEMPVTARLG